MVHSYRPHKKHYIGSALYNTCSDQMKHSEKAADESG